jgi:Domain of unknown function (DUF5710)
MIYLEITYAQKDEAKPFRVRWDPKEKLWYFPGDVLPKELERFRPANAPKLLCGSQDGRLYSLARRSSDI